MSYDSVPVKGAKDQTLTLTNRESEFMNFGLDDVVLIKAKARLINKYETTYTTENGAEKQEQRLEFEVTELTIKNALETKLEGVSL